jgi:DNA-binding protein H-NS
MPRRPGFKFNEMSVPELLRLREQIQAALVVKRQELQRQIDALSTVESGTGSGVGSGGRGRRPRADARSKRGNGRAHPLKGRTVAPKYRDPADPTQTWAGRGQAPRWLTAYETQGRKRDEFLIGATGGGRTKGRGRKRA